MLMQAMLLLRAIAGWICIIGGAVLTISPLPFGFIIVIAGVALLGPRDRGLRWLHARWHRLLSAGSTSSTPLIAHLAQRIHTFQHTVEHNARRWLAARATSRTGGTPLAAEETSRQ